MKLLKIIILLSLLLLIYSTSNAFAGSTPLVKSYDRSSLLRVIIEKSSNQDNEVLNLEEIWLLDSDAIQAIKRHVTQQIAILDEEINAPSLHSSLYDEFFRSQLWNLGQSIKILDRLFSQQAELQALNSKAKATWALGMREYALLKRNMDWKLKKRKRGNPSEDHEEEGILEFAEDHDLISEYAEAFAKETGAPRWNTDRAKCGATARAILYYLRQHEEIQGDLQNLAKNSKQGVDSLIETLRENRFKQGQSFAYFCESIRLDHVFVIQQTYNGKYRILQSFVNRYTLQANLANQEWMTFEDLVDLLKKLNGVLETKKWSEETASDYENLFFAKPHKGFADEFESASPDFSFFAAPYREKHTQASDKQKALRI